MGNAIRPSTLDLHCLLYALVASHCWEQQHAYPNLSAGFAGEDRRREWQAVFLLFRGSINSVSNLTIRFAYEVREVGALLVYNFLSVYWWLGCRKMGHSCVPEFSTVFCR